MIEPKIYVKNGSQASNPYPTTVISQSLIGWVWDQKSCQIWFTNHWLQL